MLKSLATLREIKVVTMRDMHESHIADETIPGSKFLKSENAVLSGSTIH